LEETGADGSPPYYLPHAGNTVVAACVTRDLNPDAPEVILAGDGAMIKEYADLFCCQKNVIPVCVKSEKREWLCCGYFKLKRPSTNLAEIANHSAHAKRSDVYKILFLEEVLG
jgi:hypothetical protein